MVHSIDRSHWLRWSLLCSLLLVVGCPDGGGGGDDWELDAATQDSDAGQQTDTVDGTDTNSFEPCPSAPTARLSATAPSAGGDVEGTHAGRLQVTPLPTISLDSSASTATKGHSVERVEWSVLDRPEPSLVTFGEMGLRDRQDTPIYTTSEETAPKLEVTLAGTYEIGLKVWNDQGKESCNTAVLEVDVRPESELYVDFRNPYEKIERRGSKSPGYGQTPGPLVGLSFKRTLSANWDDLENVIINTRNEKDVQDWGKKDNPADDPVFKRVRSYSGANGFVSLNGVESSISYVAAVRMLGSNKETPIWVRVYVNGQRKHMIERTIKVEKNPNGTVFEAMRLQKVNGEFQINETWDLLEDYPEP